MSQNPPAAKKSSVRSYSEIAAEANKPLGSRSPVASGRGGKKQVPRRYHMTAEETVAHRKRCEEAGRYISPYRGAEGQYNAIIQAMSLLGADKVHFSRDVYKKVEEILSREETKDSSGKTAWQRFIDKPSRNTETGRSPFRRFQQNCTVLQRLGGQNPYGFKLAQTGACLDILRVPQKTEGGKEIFIEALCLRTGITDIVAPVNEQKKRKYKRGAEGVRPGPLMFPGPSPEEPEIGPAQIVQAG